MEGFRKLPGIVAVLLLLVVVFGSVSSPAAARPTVGFPEGVREVGTAPVRPCDMAGVGVPEKKVKLTENYAPLLLNVLPRGKFPPSGPSKGINSNKT